MARATTHPINVQPRKKLITATEPAFGMPRIMARIVSVASVAVLAALLVAAALVVKFWPWLAGAVAIYITTRLVRRAWFAYVAAGERRRAGLAAIAARADQQQAWRLVGDPRGLYGEYPPAV